MTDDNDWTRLARYFAAECTADEADEIRRWIEADPERGRLVDEMRAAWDVAGVASTEWDTPASWQRLAARVRARERRPRVAAVPGGWPDHAASWRSRAGGWAAIAAAILLVAGGGLVWHRLARPSSPTVASAPPLREVRTPLRQRAELRLSDGSRVMLAPGSVLRYDTTSFGTSTRELHLDGRAYFTVTHDQRRPFLVRTAHTVTEDLGTEFGITDYSGDAATEVVVASGAVAVRTPSADSARPATVLTRGELVRLDPSGRAAIRRGVDLTAQLAWTEGRLVFADTPVAEVLAQLHRWYGIDVRLGDPALATHRFSASYTTESDSTVVRELATAIGARVERRGKVIVLVPLSNSPPEG
jgi:transmembrane sensor